MQDALLTLTRYWTERGCLIAQPFNTEVGAGTANPATFLRVLGPEPWHVAYVEPSVRPDDARYGENPNRLQMHTQFQVILKPEPGDPQELYLGSLRALGIDTNAHDIRFVEDNWAQPAIGAWGLGWEVWLDGLEITQFTYFQQVGGQALDPIPVELTYGIERILMAVQGVSHFKDIVFAPGVTYGEVYGQGEYEMSRYYLDDADIAANRVMFDTYAAEAERMIAERLPVPAYSYVLKCSHAFNVLDARGAISTTERANAFATMRRFARQVAELWIERRAEHGHPLGTASTAKKAAAAADAAEPLLDTSESGVDTKVDAPAPLLFEIGVEELPPAEVTAQVDAVRSALTEKLGATRLTHGEITVVGTPRRIVAVVDAVVPREPDAERTVRGPRVSAAFDADGKPTKALEGFARGQGVPIDELTRVEVGGNEHVAAVVVDVGRSAIEVLSTVLSEIVVGLRAAKNMRWNDGELAFSRPIRWLVALLGAVEVPVTASLLTSGRKTYVHRGAAEPWITVPSADGYLDLLLSHGIVADANRRRADIVHGAQTLAASVGGTVDVDGEAELLDQVTNLVEEPNPILGSFDPAYLELPEEILTTVMRKHQRYLPVRAADGTLAPSFVAVANGDVDVDRVRAGNESVLRARYEDAAFFWRADLDVKLEDFREALSKLTFEERIGSMADRADRIASVSALLGEGVDLSATDAATLRRAGELAKFDLAAQMVVELSSLAGTMAREYAVRAGETPAVAQALFEMELPRSSGDALPASTPGALLALADRFDLLASMFSLGAKPTGSSDPYGLRRAALGVVAILRSSPALSAVTVRGGLEAAAARLREQGVEVSTESVDAAHEFVLGRFAQQLRDEGVGADWVSAVLPGASAPGAAAATLDELRSRASDDQFRALVEAVQRIARIVPVGTEASYDASLLTEPAETRLVSAAAVLGDHTDGDVAAFVAEASALVDPVNAFFDDILVMADDPAVRAARLGLLASILDRAPRSVDWAALDTALG